MKSDVGYISLIGLFMIAFCGCASSVTPPTPSSAQRIYEIKKLIIKLGQDLARATIAKDYKALDEILADELIYVHAGGRVETKAEFIKALQGKTEYLTIEPTNELVEVYGYNVAIVYSSDARFKAREGDEIKDSHNREINIFLRLKGKWRLASHQTTKLPAQTSAPAPGKTP